MKDFNNALDYINQIMYKPNNLLVDSVHEEKQNAKYGAGTFQISSRTVRFRVANITPSKVGQFVAFWEKDENNKNQPYSYEEAPDLFVITTFKSAHEFGQFIFPKEVMFEQNMLRSSSTKGKMAIRVYPSWDSPTSKQAMNTQQWQLPYFIDMRNVHTGTEDKLMELYSS
ncbi:MULTISPECIES: MepB family protein [unclassified Sporosarcina]|uniref:MepB family protein n=1 Tax=unclassified Sporosarcina TaxID=2647733 RepID=UPI000C166939|nr:MULTISPECIES: MepB family protein [unclassified Sporosarcina]PID05517.1 mep operon protein MepB [Sporosarcina sp. P30]PID08642.1 mep operon protein MepB [Sporosarcina sp. P31]PID11644.1 mep operon protein MepB [Sporosarcina sp. P32b]